MIYPDKYLINQNTGCDIHSFDEVASTNDLAKSAAEAGAPDGTVFIAKTQSGGHGRGEKSFFCYNGGLYLSIIIRRATLPAELITSAAAAAISRAIRAASGVQTEIKWVNDLFVNNKKVCGILALHAGGAYVVGVGINVRNTEFPDDLRQIAAALGSDIDLNLLASGIINNLRREACGDAGEIIGYCRENSYTLGKYVCFVRNGISYSGRAVSLGFDGSLDVLLNSGTHIILSSGEVSVKLENS